MSLRTTASSQVRRLQFPVVEVLCVCFPFYSGFRSHVRGTTCERTAARSSGTRFPVILFIHRKQKEVFPLFQQARVSGSIHPSIHLVHWVCKIESNFCEKPFFITDDVPCAGGGRWKDSRKLHFITMRLKVIGRWRTRYTRSSGGCERIGGDVTAFFYPARYGVHPVIDPSE